MPPGVGALALGSIVGSCWAGGRAPVSVGWWFRPGVALVPRLEVVPPGDYQTTPTPSRVETSGPRRAALDRVGAVR